MDRRDLLKMIAVLTGGAVVGANAFLTGCTNTEKINDYAFDEQDIAFLDEVAETILPATKTPGAKAAGVGSFMTVYVNDCYEEKDQRVFHEGMDKLNESSRKKFDKSFMNITPQQRHELIVEIDNEAREYQIKKGEFDKKQTEEEERAKAQNVKDFKKQEMPVHYFTLIKQLALLGYFTSKEALTQAFNFVAVPGKYVGCVDYKEGDKLMVNLDGST